MFEISFIIGFGYMMFTSVGRFTTNPQKQYYVKLLENKHFFANLFFAGVVALFGYWRISIDKREVCYFLPLIYLITLRLFNYVSLILKHRRIIIITRWDSSKGIKGGITWFDRLLGFLVFLIPIITCGLIMNNVD